MTDQSGLLYSQHQIINTLRFPTIGSDWHIYPSWYRQLIGVSVLETKAILWQLELFGINDVYTVILCNYQRKTKDHLYGPALIDSA